MRSNFRPILAVLMFLAMLGMSIGASACQEPKDSLQQQFDEALGVFRAKVMRAEVTHTKDLGVSCDAERCDLLEVRLRIIEELKGKAKEFEVIYSPVAVGCGPPILVGWEYVFFLGDYEGLSFPEVYSFGIGGGDTESRLAELRKLKANQDSRD